MTLQEKRAFLRTNGWVEVLEDCWVDKDIIVTKPDINYFLASRTLEQAYNLEVERQKKKIEKFDGVTYLTTTDPFEIGDWVMSAIGKLEVTEKNYDVLKSHNCRKIISCTNNDGMKHVGYLIIEKA